MQAKNLKKIKTYMNRQSRMTVSQRIALQNLWPQYGLELGSNVINFHKIYGRTAPVVLEIGFGMGNSFLAMAKTHPECNFLGIEVHRPGIGALLIQLAKEDLQNVRIYNADAREVLVECIPDSSLACILIFFPDPWPKRRHHKRRLIQNEFVKLLGSKLKSAGIIHLATDWEDYAKQMLTIIAALPEFKNISHDEKFKEQVLYRNATKFEQRGKKLGHTIWDLIFVKSRAHATEIF